MTYDLELLPERIASRIVVDGTTGCWVWTGSTVAHNGYGRVRIDGARPMLHRYVYELFVGPIPEALMLDHVRARGCRSRACCNPAHLEPVTHIENCRRGDGGLRFREQTHCTNGHPFDAVNTYVYPRTGHRQCRECARASHRRWLAEHGHEFPRRLTPEQRAQDAHRAREYRARKRAVA